MKNLRTIAQRYLLPSLPLDPKGRLTLQEGRGRGLCGSRFKVRGSRFMLALLTIFNFQFSIFNLTSCAPEPPLHLYNDELTNISLPAPKLSLEVQWNYDIVYQIKYDWKAEWYYGWDDGDRSIWGEIEPTEPTKFYLRRYYTGNIPFGPHLTYDDPPPFYGNHYQDHFDWGFWDILVYNEPQVNVISVHFNENDHDDIIAYTKESGESSRHYAPRYTRAFYAPEPLYAGYKQAEEINSDLRGFDYDEVNNIWVRKLELVLLPVTYVYLTQIILHNNKGRITGVAGTCNLTGMAHETHLHTRRAGDVPVSVNYECKMKSNIPYIPLADVLDPKPDSPDPATAERVDVIGGRLVTFGICGLAPWDDINEETMTPDQIRKKIETIDKNDHIIELTFTFANTNATLQKDFDVTDQVKKYFKGGVLTIELNVDDLEIPEPGGGGGLFDPVIEDYSYEEHEIPIEKPKKPDETP